MGFKKKIISFLLAFILILGQFSGVSMANSDASEKKVENKDSVNNKKDVDSEDNVDNEEKDVRIIVELNSKSLVEEAISQGKTYQELSENFKEKKSKKLKKEQDKLIKNLENKKIDLNKSGTVNYDTAINGVGITVKQKDIKTIENSSNVRNVYYSQEFERPLLKSQQEIIGANQAWKNFKYKGEGTVVAVIDSGIDVSHKALALDDNSRVKYTKNQMQEAINENNLKGKYFTEKVPYGYNYYDFSTNLKDSYGNMHGMHVAGIVGSNSKDTKTYGVAPNTQILAMKVFSDDLQFSTTFTDVWLKALDDAIKLKADVVNMSLGSAAGFNIDEDKAHPEIQIFSKARKAGIVISVAVGNDASLTHGSIFGEESRAENYDTGLVANPAINKDSLAVASMENLKKHVYAISWKAPDEKSEDVNLYIPQKVKENVVGKVIDLKEAKEFDKVSEGDKLPDVKDKIVLVQWPESTERKEIFETTLNNIALKKPKAILLGRPDDRIHGRLVLDGEAGNLVYGIIKNSTYRSLATLPMLERLKIYDTNVTINVKQKEVDNPLAGRMSDFSTWGPTPDLRIKPEITGVGGNIYSTIENDDYRNMSGTSMASPQVAGASLILKQYLDEKKIGETNKSDLIKTMLMNTANQLSDPNSENGKVPYFVRRQGAGVLNLENALKAKAYVEAIGTNDDIYDGKLELRQIDSLKFKASLKITNITNEKLMFNPDFVAFKELIVDGFRKEVPVSINGSLNSHKTIEIAPKETKTVEMEFDFSNSNLSKDNFIEGFIVLKANEKSGSDLSVPFLGFYGDWGNQRAIDAFAIPEYNKESRNAQFIINPDINAYSSRFITKHALSLPLIDNKVFFSPDSEYFPEIGVSISPLRNMEEIEYSILDGNTKKTLRVFGKSLNVRKLSRLSTQNTFRVMPESFWDGMINGKPAEPEKVYIYQMKVKLNNGGYGNNEQIYQYPVVIDNKKPTVDKDNIDITKLEDRMIKLKLTLEDRGSGLEDLYIQTVGFIKQNNDSQGPGFDNTPPGVKPPFDNSPPRKRQPINTTSQGNVETNLIENQSFDKLNKLTETDGEKSLNKAVISTGEGKPEYGRFVSLKFLKEKPKSGKFATVENGKLKINPDDYDFNQYALNIPVFINGHEGKIEVEVPVLADKTHLEIAAKDYLSNSETFRIATGFTNDFYAINFSSYNNSIDKNNMKVFIDDYQIKDSSEFPYFTDKKEIKIKIQYDGDNSHLSNLAIRKGKNIENIIKDSVIQDSSVEKYSFKYNEAEKYIEFIIKDINSSFEVITNSKDGKMPYDGNNEDIKIDFSGVDLRRFEKIFISNKEQNLDDLKNGIEVKSGQKIIEFIFGENAKRDTERNVSSIVIKTKNGETKLVRGQYFDIIGGKQGYSSSPYSININYNFTEDSKIIINYSDGTNSNQGNLSNDDYPEKMHPGHGDADHVHDDENPYPAIFVSTPSLLSILDDFNTNNNKIRLNGFVGYMNSLDTVKSMNIYLVDNHGNKISEGVTLGYGDFTIDPDLHYGSTYAGRADLFTAELDLVDRFNINIKFDIVTDNGIEASIVRRVLYDRVLPTVEYMVEPRALESDKAKVRLKSKDDSIELSLYKGDSLIEKVNKTAISFETDTGVEVTKEVELDLEYGQNKIVFSARDLSGKVTTKTVYIYRAYDGEVEIEDLEENKTDEAPEKIETDEDSEATETDKVPEVTETDEAPEKIEKDESIESDENPKNSNETTREELEIEETNKEFTKEIEKLDFNKEISKTLKEEINLNKKDSNFNEKLSLNYRFQKKYMIS